VPRLVLACLAIAFALASAGLSFAGPPAVRPAPGLEAAGTAWLVPVNIIDGRDERDSLLATALGTDAAILAAGRSLAEGEF
jgi:hypothetical protein